MPAEATQYKGMEGARLARRWLDRTTRVKISYDAYEWDEQVALPPLAGPVQRFDLYGHLLDEDGKTGKPLFVECKAYETAGQQGTAYVRYLANCYSVVAKARSEGMDKNWEFMWLTWHPFSVTHWSKIRTEDYLRQAVEKHADEVLPKGHDIDDQLCRSLVDRLWVVVLGERHEELTMGKWLIARVRALQEERSGS